MREEVQSSPELRGVVLDLDTLLPGMLLDGLEEVAPGGGLGACIRDFLTAEGGHGTQVVHLPLCLEGGDRDLGNVDDEVVLDDLIVLNVLLTLRDGLQDVLRLGGLARLGLEEALECELALVHLVNSVLAILDIGQGLATVGLDAFLARNALEGALYLKHLPLDPVPHMLERVPHGRRVIHQFLLEVNLGVSREELDDLGV